VRISAFLSPNLLVQAQPSTPLTSLYSHPQGFSPRSLRPRPESASPLGLYFRVCDSLLHWFDFFTVLHNIGEPSVPDQSSPTCPALSGIVIIFFHHTSFRRPEYCLCIISNRSIWILFASCSFILSIPPNGMLFRTIISPTLPYDQSPPQPSCCHEAFAPPSVIYHAALGIFPFTYNVLPSHVCFRLRSRAPLASTDFFCFSDAARADFSSSP